MAYIKLLHVLFVIIWLGSLLTLSRLLGKTTKFSENTQKEIAPVFQRLYYFVDLPAMVLAVIFGVVLLVNKAMVMKEGWFHMKLTFVALLIICDVAVGKWIDGLVREPDTGKGVKYKILHGFCGLFLIAVLFSIYILKP